MKSYPSIPHYGEASTSGIWYGYEKLDGSLIRIEWTPKGGFCKIGRRDGLLDDSNPFLVEAPAIFEEITPSLDDWLRRRRSKFAIAFFEFVGENSFAGNHEVEPHRLVFIDLTLDKKGFVEPRVLRELSDVVDSASLIHTGPIESDTIKMIEEGAFPGMSFEGVVFKRNERSRRFMWKHKSRQWLQKLRNRCGQDEKLFQKLR